MSRARASIILAAGQGTRMKSATPKVLHRVGGRAMLDWAIAAARAAGAERIIVVAGAHAPAVAAAAERSLGAGCVAIQDPPLGTGHAVRAAEPLLADFDGDLFVQFADTPMLTAHTLARLTGLRDAGADIALLGFEAAVPGAYGRILRDGAGRVTRIVEARDATDAERAVRLCNAGVLCADARKLFGWLARITNANAKGEYYLTDCAALAVGDGAHVGVDVCTEEEVMGVNARDELAAAEAIFQARARARAMAGGVTLIAPDTVYFSHDTVLGEDVTVEPNVVFGPGVTIAGRARIKAFSHLEGAVIGAGAEIGPFARLRPGTDLAEDVRIGNFVEVKKARIGAGAKANHLSYLGDAVVGARANIGAGTIVCNYDGFDKHQTEIGEEAFIGSNSSLVAPVRVGARAYTGSGSVITRDIPDDALGLERSTLTVKDGWAVRFRDMKRAARARRGV